MQDISQKQYTTLFTRVEETMTYINSEMVLKETYDWNHVREILLKLQAALEEAEEIYVSKEE